MRYEARPLSRPDGDATHGIYRVAPDGVATLLAYGTEAECRRLAAHLNAKLRLP